MLECIVFLVTTRDAAFRKIYVLRETLDNTVKSLYSILAFVLYLSTIIDKSKLKRRDVCGSFRSRLADRKTVPAQTEN